jgi:hypothetical protein
MSVKGDARTLAAEMLAVKTVIAHVLGRIDQLDPVLAEAVRAGFEDAANQIRKTGAKSRTTSEQAIKAIAIIEALGAATFSKIGDRDRSSVANDNK